MKDAITFFNKKGIATKDILVTNVAENWGLIRNLKKAKGGGNLEYPEIYIADTRIGSLSDLENSENAEKITALLSKNLNSSLMLSVNDLRASAGEELVAPQQTTSDEVPKEYTGEDSQPVTGWMNAGQWLLMGFLGGVWDAGNYLLGYSANSEKEKPAELLSPEIHLGASLGPAIDGAIDVEVIRINWYYRNQLRAYRFYPLKNFLRYDPAYKTVKEIFTYDEIKDIQHTDDVNMIISFVSGKASQYIRSPRNREIVDIINKRTSKNFPLGVSK